MVRDDQEKVRRQPSLANVACLPLWKRNSVFTITTAIAACISVIGFGFFSVPLRGQPEINGAAPASGSSQEIPSFLYREWPQDRKPDLVLFLTGQQVGYIQPCGCSKPQYGGLERRYNFIQELTKKKGWTLITADLGEIMQNAESQNESIVHHLGAQNLVKYKYSMEALNKLEYSSVGIGLDEIRMPLLVTLGAYALNNPKPVVLCDNLKERNTKFADLVHSGVVEGGTQGKPKVGIIGALSPGQAEEAEKLDSDARFISYEKSMAKTLEKLDGLKPELRVLLLQGSVKEAKECARRFPQFQVIQCLSQEEEPPEKPDMVGNTMIVTVGHKGRYVGLVGIYRSSEDPNFKLYYQLVRVGPEYETPAGKEGTNPILPLLEDYAKEVKRENFLAQYPKIQHPLQREFQDATYVGSEKCKKCHEYAFEVWKKSPHAHAYESLEKATRPSLRQYDGECVVCHVTGFGYSNGFSDEKQTAHLKNNGCENCHGPCSIHVSKGRNTPQRMFQLMNPFKGKPGETVEEKGRRELLVDRSCQKCHDIDNDNNWKFSKWFDKKIVHRTPKEDKVDQD